LQWWCQGEDLTAVVPTTTTTMTTVAWGGNRMQKGKN
jgi:hypothetical protein